MKTQGNLTKLGTRMILGKRTTISEFKNVRFYRIGQCNIQANNVDEAVARYIACKEKNNGN